MLYNNDPKKVETLDELLVNSGYFDYLRKYDSDVGESLKDFEKDYLLHVASEEELDGVIEFVKRGLELHNMGMIDDALEINNFPVLYKGNLVFGMQKYLHWFRGYYYQMSYTPDGIGTVQSPYFWMRDTLQIVHNTVRYCKEYEGVEEFVLSMSALSTALNYYSKMRKMLSTAEGVKEFDQFLAENYARHFPYHTNFDTPKVLDCFSEEVCPVIPSDILVSNAVLLGHGMTGAKTVAILAVTDDSIKVVVKLNRGYRVATFALPDWYTDSHNVYEAEFGENPYKASAYPIESLVQFVLMYCGVRISCNGFFHMRKDVDRKNSITVNLPIILDVSGLDDFFLKRF